MDMMSMTAVELGKKIKAGEISVMEATKACIENIKTYDKEYNCFITVDEEGAFKQAEEIQKKIDSGELTGPLAGVPIAIKDNMCQNGVLTNLIKLRTDLYIRCCCEINGSRSRDRR